MKRLFWALLIIILAAQTTGAQQTLDPRILPPGVPRQMQVDGVNLPDAPTVNLQDSATIDVTNPSAGVVNWAIKNGVITDAMLTAGGITTRTKLPVSIMYDDEANTVTGALTIGTTGSFSIQGSTSGTITIGRQAAAGTYNFNLPTGAGTAGQPLLSGGGGATAMSFGILGLAGGGTGTGSWIASRCVRVNAGGTALEAAGFDCGTGTGGAITTINGTTNEIGVSGGTGPTATLSLPATLALSGKVILGATPLVFEGLTPDAYRTSIAIVDPTAARTLTIPDADSVTVRPLAAVADNFVTGLSAAGVLSIAQLDPDITALGANAATGFWTRTGAGAGASRTFTVASGLTCTFCDGVGGNPVIGIDTNMVKTDRNTTLGAFLYDYAGSQLRLPIAASDPGTTTGNIQINSATNRLRVAINSVLRTVLLDGTDCPTGPVTFTASTTALGCGTYPGGTVSGTTGKGAVFTGASAVGNSAWYTEDGTGALVIGASRFGTTGTNDYKPNFAAITGHKTRNMKNVDGDEAVTTGTLTDGNVAKFNASGQIVRGGTSVKQAGFIMGADDGSVLVDTNDQATIFVNLYGQGITITKVWCESDAGNPTIQFQKNDGSPTNMFSSALTCDPTPTGTNGTDGILTSFVSGENQLADGNRINLLTVAAGGTAKRYTVFFTYTMD